MVFDTKIKLTVKRVMCLVTLLLIVIGGIWLTSYSFKHESVLFIILICVIAVWFGYLYAMDKGNEEN